MNVLLAISLCVLFIGADGFSLNFNQWLVRKYGKETADKMLIRSDMGARGSYGGKRQVLEEFTHQPVLLVHGLSDYADKLTPMVHSYVANGYQASEVFASTWGQRLAWHEPAKCLYIKRVRMWIEAISAYAGSKIDIVAHSMGVPLTRKAILGGKCVDTGEDLGPPITDKVDTFVGIAGSNLGVPFCGLGGAGTTCDENIGLWPGNCHRGPSTYLKELLDTPPGFEGEYVYTIMSTADILVPHNMCGRLSSALPGQNGQRIYNHLDHWKVLVDTVFQQIKMIKLHKTK